MLRQNVGQEHVRSNITPRYWRKIKANVQTLAKRSFVTLADNFQESLLHIFYDYKINNISIFEVKSKVDLLFNKTYQKTYMLGAKASGLGIFQAFNTFSRLSKNPDVVKENPNLLDKINEAKSFFIKDLPTFNSRFVEKQLIPHIKRLETIYDTGRLHGAPANSLVYFKKYPFTSICPDCSYAQHQSPFRKEDISFLPGDCSNCESEIRIIPVSKLRYDAVLAKS